MNVQILGVAQAEALDAADWYDQQTSGTGTRFLSALDALVAELTRHPWRFSRVSRPPRGRDIRRAQLPGFPFTAVYEVAAEVVILSVTHARSVRQPWRRRVP